MRINETNATSKSTSARKKKNAGEGGTFSIDMDNGPEKPSEVIKPQNISNIQSVLSLGSLELLSNLGDEAYEKQKNMDWGRDILNQLSDIKYQILNGKISYNSLLGLKDRLKNIPINPQDYKLQQIIGEIETRAAVEIEKLKKITNLVDDEV